jgi:adenylate cyclase
VTDEEARSALRAVLLGLGTDEAEISRAEQDGTLDLLAVERLMVPEPARYDEREVVDRTGLSLELLRQLWRSLGYPEPSPDEKVFTETDVEILARVGDLITADPQRTGAILQVSRVIGSSMSRIASAQVDAITGPLAGVEGVEPKEDEEVVIRAGALLPVVPRVVEVVWRRHLQAAARRRMIQVSRDDRTAEVLVGFADLVGFTALSQQVDEIELASILRQFEDLVYDVITTGGGRVIKTIGDEVMFVVTSPKAAAEIALALVEGTRASDELSDVRVGLAIGPALEREADLYGPVVNLASRITVIAFPGSVVVAREVADALAGDPDYVLRQMRPRYLKGIGRLQLAVLRRTEPVEGRFDKRRQALRDAVRARLDPR